MTVLRCALSVPLQNMIKTVVGGEATGLFSGLLQTKALPPPEGLLPVLGEG